LQNSRLLSFVSRIVEPRQADQSGLRVLLPLWRSPARKDRKVTAYNVLILFVVGLGSVSYCYASIFEQSHLRKAKHDPQVNLLSSNISKLANRSNGTDLEASMNGLLQTGGVIGTLLLPIIADQWGRKAALALANLISKYLIFVCTLKFV
jgi:MFS family permease